LIRQTELNDVIILAIEHKEATNSGIQKLITDTNKKNKGQEKFLNWDLIEEFQEKQQMFEFFNYWDSVTVGSVQGGACVMVYILANIHKSPRCDNVYVFLRNKI
jgi:hypothetical protein